jgi:hypothetical protein
MTQETTPQVAEVESGISEEDAASEILKRMGVGTDDTSTEEQSTEETESTEADEATTEETEEAEEESTEESEEVEIDVAGEKFKLPAALKEIGEKVQAKAKEVEAGATRKFQEAADLRKFAEAHNEHAKQLTQLSQVEIGLMADQTAIGRRLNQIMSIDVAALSEQDPAMLARLTAEAQQLQFAQSQIGQKLDAARADSSKAKDAAVQQRMDYLGGWASKNISGWSADYSQALLEFSVKELGADPTALRDVMSEPVLKALDLAYRGWKVQKADPKAKQVQSSKTLKPGATGQVKTTGQKTVETTTRRFAQTKKVDDAAAAIFARMQSGPKRR